MILLTHLGIALLSLIISTATLIAPSKTKLHNSYILTALTFVSGSYLVYISNASLLRSCISGIAYLAVITSMNVAARYRLAQQNL